MNNAYKYYARTSGVEPWEVYRCPANELPLLQQSISEIQKANRNHSWKEVDSIQGLWEESLTGWFDENDAITLEKAKSILVNWGISFD
jgi:hypothetical protein